MISTHESQAYTLKRNGLNLGTVAYSDFRNGQDVFQVPNSPSNEHQPPRRPLRRRVGTVTRPVMDGLVLANSPWAPTRSHETLTPTSIETTFARFNFSSQPNGLDDKKLSTTSAPSSGRLRAKKNSTTSLSSSNNSVEGDPVLGKVRGSFLDERKVSDVSYKMIEEESDLIYFVT